MSPIQSLNLEVEQRAMDLIEERKKEKAPKGPIGKTQWKKQLKSAKQDWADENAGAGPGFVELTEYEVSLLNVSELNQLYDQVMNERAQIAQGV